MNFRILNRRVLAAGLVLTAIFITISTASIVSGAEPEQAETEQRSRLHPKRIFSGLKRGVSKLFGRDEEEATPVPELPKAPLPVVSQQIDQQRIAHETARRTRDPFMPPRPAGAIVSKSTQPLTAPSISLPQTVQRSLPQTVQQIPQTKVDFNDVKRQAEKVVAAASEIESENPFADFNFDEPLDKSAGKVIDAAVTAASPVVTRKITRAAQQQETAPEVKHLLGYCPVNLRAGKFQRGKPEFSTVYLGRTYRFASQEALNEFVRNPDPYAPVLQGIDVIEMRRTGRHVEGYLSFSCDYDGRFYLFRSTQNQEEFLSDPTRFAVPR
ncbi:YHS domain protein [Symmachiella dynata]|uniref:hypothetical protein n=1 Tax=Symmachiella dynata TaxID=2527995 RepID=UPI00118BB996|nr:hypothetical protein [Symmachiella dynata]QDT50886.1 YHS domain protein [Symmachiella dynata]